MKNIIWEITMEEKNNKEKIAEESVQSNENTVVEEANNKELEINKEETTVEQESAEAEKIVETSQQKEAAESTKEFATQEDSEQKQTAKKKDSKSEESEQEEKENGRYKVIAKLEPNLWTYGSPVLFEKGTLERDQVSNINRLSLIFTNIYEEKEIRDLYITIYADDGEGNVEQINHSYLAMGQEYLASKGKAAKITIKNENAVKFIIKIDKVVFVDGSVWTKKDAVLESAGEMEDVEVFAQAKTKDYEDNYISGMEEVQKDDSASIGNGIEILKRIAWYKNSKELIKTAHKKYDIAVKNEERKQASEDRRVNRQKDVKKKYMTVLTAVGVIIVIAAIATVTFFIPNKKYKSAEKLIKNQKYTQAVTAFKDLGGFRKSKGFLAEAYYNLGLQALNEKDEDKASDYFKKSNDADKSSEYGKQAGAFLDYYAATDALDKKDYDKAQQLFTSSAQAASDFNLINKASAGMAQVSYIKADYSTAWQTIKNVYAKDNKTFQAQYAEYGYAYAKQLIDKGSIKDGMEVYSKVEKLSKSANLSESVYNQAVKLGEAGKIQESLNLLNQIKGNYAKAKTLYDSMNSFHKKVSLWLGTWKHRGTVNGEKTTYYITFSEVLYKGEPCIKIKDMNNKSLGYDVEISSKNHITQIEVGKYMIHFKLKNNHNQKLTYTLLEGKKMLRELKYEGVTYKTKYKKK